MITGSVSSHNAYNSAAHTRAAAMARGDYKGAAYAQAEMDKEMADILKINKRYIVYYYMFSLKKEVCSKCVGKFLTIQMKSHYKNGS